MILIALALIGVGIWNLIVGMTVIGWICIGMAVLQGYFLFERYVHGDNW